MSPPSERERAFVEYLARLAAVPDRAALAALRRSVGKALGEVVEACRYVVPWLPAHAGGREEAAYYLVAGLFAWHPQPWPSDGEARGPRNFGASLRRLLPADDAAETLREEGRERLAPLERRFMALLACHRDALPEHLRRLMGLLRAAEIPVDWAQLLHDVQRWDWEDRPVQRAWARAFWAAAEPGPDPATVADGR